MKIMEKETPAMAAYYKMHGRTRHDGVRHYQSSLFTC